MQKFFFINLVIFTPLFMDFVRNFAFILIFALFLAIPFSSNAGEMGDNAFSQPSQIDSILNNLRYAALKFSAKTPDYDAQVYIQGNVDVQKVGKFLTFIPYFNHIERVVKNYSSDYIGAISFTNPNIYNQSLYSISVKKSSFINEYVDVLTQMTTKMNVYSQYLMGNLYSPLAYLSGKYYTFKIDDSGDSLCDEYIKIFFEPKMNNNKFIDGYMVVSSRNWSVRELKFSGNMEFVNYNSHIIMGKEFSPDEFLPSHISISSQGNILGTQFTSGYVSKLKYVAIKEHAIKEGIEIDKNKYDLTLRYNTDSDTLSMAADYIRKYRDSLKVKDTLVVIKKHQSLKRVGQFMVNDYSIDLKNNGELNMMPLVSPILFDYSTSKGLSYNQSLKYKRPIKEDRIVFLEPHVGYNFKYKEFYAGLNGEYLYKPRNMGSFYLDLGNGNKFFLKHNGEDPSLPNPITYRELHATVGHKIEIANGLLFKIDTKFIHYKNVDNSTASYSNFVPEVELMYTPGQYYYMDGNRKVYLYSRYPTFTLNYATALRGVMNSSFKYNKLEFDIQQKLQVGPMHTFNYRIGFGLYYDYNNLYFSEFNNLRRNHLPQGWNDDVGGTFHLLPPARYNEIDKYIRASLKYDAPLFLVPTLFKRVKYITKERLYSSLLLVDTMDPYLEMGYGLGSTFCNIVLFWGGEITKLDMFGIKFTFEAFH